MKTGLFVTIEGLDGCGKTTQLRLLAKRLRERGRHVVETVEPGGTLAGDAIRAILLDPEQRSLSADAELLLYFASRAQNVAQVIAPALANHALVLCDRFTDSTVVYQGAGRGIPQATIRALHEIACGSLYPHLTLLLDIDLQTSLERARRRNQASGTSETRLDDESCAFFERVRDEYRKLAAAEPGRIVTIDARDSVECVEQRIWCAMAPVLEKYER